MREHIKILGILNIVMGGLTALAGLVVLLAMGGIAGIVALGANDGSMSDVENAKAAAPIVGLIGGIIGVFLLALAAPSIIGGWGLLKYKSWSRVLMIIVSGFHLLSVPFGTALGIYGLWALLKEESQQLLESGGLAPPPPAYPMSRQAAGFGSQPRP